jgi:large subunit ribosomal protein L2
MKSYKPITPSRRKMTTVTYRGVLTTNDPYKPLTSGFKRGVGRNAFGRITSPYKGGGHKRSFREIDFKYDIMDIPAKIQTVEYDPNRSGFIGLVAYANGAKRYVLLPKVMKVGDKFIVSEKADLEVGNRTRLSNIPVGTFVYNIEVKPRAGAKLVRSAGVYAQVVAHDNGYTSIKLPSTEVRKVTDTCFASIGEVSNEEYRLRNVGKAGRSRHLGSVQRLALWRRTQWTTHTVEVKERSLAERDDQRPSTVRQPAVTRLASRQSTQTYTSSPVASCARSN